MVRKDAQWPWDGITSIDQLDVPRKNVYSHAPSVTDLLGFQQRISMTNLNISNLRSLSKLGLLFMLYGAYFQQEKNKKLKSK